MRTKAFSRSKRRGKGNWTYSVLILGIVIAFAASAPQTVTHAATGDWSTFLGNLAHTGYNPYETTINPTTATHLKLHWSVQTNAASRISSEPVEANGMVYWGSWDGLEHASRIADGSTAWSTNLGTASDSCITKPQGVVSTAIVTGTKINGVSTPVVIVGGGSSTLYALNANTGAIIWQTVLSSASNTYLWGSPTVFQNNVYIGVAALADCPVIAGEVVQLNATTGAILHTFSVVPSGCIGGDVWSSPSIDVQTGVLYVATGNEGQCSTSETMADALLALQTSNLSLVGSWQVPKAQRIYDGDFGAVPTLFQATINGVLHRMVGLANKNGIYYAFDSTNISAGPLWQIQIAQAGSNPIKNGSVSSSLYDGNRLYVAGGITTINGTSCAGSVRALNPATGAFLWQRCINSAVIAPVIGVPKLLVVGSGNSFYVMSATTGNTLFSYLDTHGSSSFWAAASISNGVLYEVNKDDELYAFGT